MQSFSDLAIPASIKNALQKMNFITPTEVQAMTLPIALEGHDVIACACTGSGKTGAFAIPAITMLINNPDKNALVLAPTRELAQQISEFMRQITDYCEGISMVSIVGGFDMSRQLNALRRKPRIIIATPGRLTDHLRRRSVSLANTGILILDEGDRMLDMGFAPQLDAILQFLPQKRQTMMFTATMPPKVKELSRQYLHKPKDVNVGKTSQPVETVAQFARTVPQEKKNEVLLEELSKRSGSVIVFARTQRRTDALAHYLEDYGVDVTTIHGGLTQGKRNRAIQGFKRGEYRVLVATDIAARGIDVPAVEHVINFDLPLMDEDYVHRVGRTARNGAKGEALSFVSHHEYGLWANIARKYNIHSDDVLDPRRNKKGKGKGRPDRPMAQRPGRSKDNSFFVADELPPMTVNYGSDEGVTDAAGGEALTVRAVAEQRRSEKVQKGFPKNSEAFDPEDRIVEKALAEENLALDMQDGIRIPVKAPEGFIPADRYAKRKKFGADRNERFGKGRKFDRPERPDRDEAFGDEEGDNRGSKPFMEKFFDGSEAEGAEAGPERKFEERGGEKRFSKPAGDRGFKPRTGFKKFGEDRADGPRRFGNNDRFGGGGRFGNSERSEGPGRFKKNDGFESRGRFGSKDRFDGAGRFEKNDRGESGGHYKKNDGFESRGRFGNNDRSGGAGAGGSRFKRNDGFESRGRFGNNDRSGGPGAGAGRFKRNDGFESRGRFEKRDQFASANGPKRSFADRGEKRWDNKGSDKRDDRSSTSSFGGADRPQKKANWFSRDKDRRSTNSRRPSGPPRI